MTRICLTALIALLPVMAPADGSGGAAGLTVAPLQSDTLDQLRWQSRPVVILGTPSEVRDQITALQSSAPALSERDVVLLTDGPGAGRLAPDAGFRVVLIGKDGGIKLDRTQPVSPDQIIALIDQMPMRRREVR